MNFFRAVLCSFLLSAFAFGQSGTYAIVDVSVIPMDRETVLQHQTVIVSGGKISALGSLRKTRPPQGAQIIHNFVYDIAHCQPTWTPALCHQPTRKPAGNGRSIHTQ